MPPAADTPRYNLQYHLSPCSTNVDAQYPHAQPATAKTGLGGGDDIAEQQHVIAPAITMRNIGLTGSRVRAARGKPAQSLTSRQIEVLHWVARGKSFWEIGEILHISQRTVVEHVQNAVRKMNAANRIHAVALAIRDRIIDV